MGGELRNYDFLSTGCRAFAWQPTYTTYAAFSGSTTAIEMLRVGSESSYALLLQLCGLEDGLRPRSNNTAGGELSNYDVLLNFCTTQRSLCLVQSDADSFSVPTMDMYCWYESLGV